MNSNESCSVVLPLVNRDVPGLQHFEGEEVGMGMVWFEQSWKGVSLTQDGTVSVHKLSLKLGADRAHYRLWQVSHYCALENIVRTETNK